MTNCQDKCGNVDGSACNNSTGWFRWQCLRDRPCSQKLPSADVKTGRGLSASGLSRLPGTNVGYINRQNRKSLFLPPKQKYNTNTNFRQRCHGNQVILLQRMIVVLIGYQWLHGANFPAAEDQNEWNISTRPKKRIKTAKIVVTFRRTGIETRSSFRQCSSWSSARRLTRRCRWISLSCARRETVTNKPKISPDGRIC